ncbi:MAG: ergothioneine biosynthesis protein EgtB [Hyphomicrobiales bacterium]|nr:ergothioneine biosynthesis protein EgtB [Hyphomicrobiales bacterium]
MQSRREDRLTSNIQLNDTNVGTGNALADRITSVRGLTEGLATGLSDADATVQSMDDASPAKWHLAHTTWFFETMILKENLEGYVVFDVRFPYLFNSYYEALGARHPRPLRGLLTRPSLDTVLAYRAHVDDGLQALMANPVSPDVEELLVLGIHHEQQHQELLLTDILHLFAQNPLRPAYRPGMPLDVDTRGAPGLHWTEFDGGRQTVGYRGDGFAFDCEGPSHDRLVEPFRLASRCVTNAEWIEFIAAGGYQSAMLWLSDGWATVNLEGWTAPFYWENRDGQWWSMTLRGAQPVDPNAPVAHISYFEADAFATFARRRLPTEFEWELASHTVPLDGKFNMLASDRLRPATARGDGLAQMFGDVWEWTRSAFSAYPGYKPDPGAVGEYNGKFMNGQYVLKGGSCVTPPDHIRRSYRNFFQPDKRWQFSGVRLAEDL